MLDKYDLTVVADPNQRDEYVMVPHAHPAIGELAAAGVQPCGVEVAESGQEPVVIFGVSSGMGVRRLLYWWSDWSRVAALQQSAE